MHIRMIVRKMFAVLHWVHTLATLIVHRSHTQHAVQKLMTFMFWCWNKFLAGDALGRSSDGSNTHRIAAASCHLHCRLYHENERFGTSNLCTSSRYLRKPFHPGGSNIVHTLCQCYLSCRPRLVTITVCWGSVPVEFLMTTLQPRSSYSMVSLEPASGK